MNGLAQALARACEELGLQIEFDFALMLADKSRIVALANSVTWRTKRYVDLQHLWRGAATCGGTHSCRVRLQRFG